jgi:hypothetical protein
MPFTISHVAAVLPFYRVLARWRLLSATVIGSMVPDFGFLMPWRPPRFETHSAPALLTFCLPVGLATFWLFHTVIKVAVVEVLPNSAYARWREAEMPVDLRSLTQWMLAACGIEVGAISHIIWDAFTHEGARGVRMIPALDDPVVDFAGHHLMGTRLLQDVSSLIGLAVVLLLVIYGLRPGPVDRSMIQRRRLGPLERSLWIVTYGIMALVLAGLFLVIRHPHFLAAGSLGLVIANYAIAALRGFAAAVLVVSLGLTLRLRASRGDARAT